MTDSHISDRLKEQLAAARADSTLRVTQQLTLAEKGLGALMLANGGALVALFTFVGKFADAKAAVRFDLSNLWSAFALFSGGLAATLLAFLFAFLSQDRAYHQCMQQVDRLHRSIIDEREEAPTDIEVRYNLHGTRSYVWGMLFAFLSILFFMIGCGFALAGALPR